MFVGKISKYDFSVNGRHELGTERFAVALSDGLGALGRKLPGRSGRGGGVLGKVEGSLRAGQGSVCSGLSEIPRFCGFPVLKEPISSRGFWHFCLVGLEIPP